MRGNPKKARWAAGLLLVAVGLGAGPGGLGPEGPGLSVRVEGQPITSWQNPSQQVGLFSNPTGAFADGGGRARFRQFQIHFYGGYGIALPPGAQVVGLEVRLDAWDRRQRGGVLAVELSWNGGAGWTTTGYTTGPLPATEQTILLGGPTDTWGRSWTPAELSDPNFWVRIFVLGFDVRGGLDWVPVRVYYTLPGQSLSVAPITADFGTLGGADYDRGYGELSPAQTVTVDSVGTDWVLYVESDAPRWTYAGPYPDPLKPAGDLRWRTTSSDPRVTALVGTYTPLSPTPAPAASGTAGTGIALEVHLRARLSYDRDPPGSYSLGVTYTLTTP